MKKFRVLKRLFLVCLLCAMSVGVKAQIGELKPVAVGGTYITDNIKATFTSFGQMTEYASSPMPTSKVTGIVNGAFDNEALVIPEDLKWWTASTGQYMELSGFIVEITDAAFYSSTITSLSIPKGAVKIGKQLVNYCPGLMTITIDAANPKYTSRDGSGNNINAIIEKSTNTIIAGCNGTTIPSTVTSIADYAFCGLAYDQTHNHINIPGNVKKIGTGAFKHNFTGTINLGEGIEEIGNDAFAWCPYVQALDIPQSVKKIGAGAFNFDLSAVGAQYASQLTSVTVHWTSASELPTVTGDPCFPYSGRILYVPDGTKSIYQAADYWKNFNIVEIKEPKGLVFIGNSLTANPYNYIIWPMGPTDSKYFAYDARGMAASVTGNDFVSQVIHGFFGKTRAQIDSEAGSIEARQDFYAIASPKLNEISSDNRIEKHLDYLNTNEQTGIANMDKMFTQQNININGDLHEADATIWPKYAIVQFGENIAGPNATEINAAYRNVYKYFIDHTCVQHIYQVFAYNNTVGAAIQTAVSDMQSYAASKGKTLEYVDVSTVVGVGYFQNKDFILKDDGTEFKLDDAIFDFSAVRGHPSDIGHNAIAQEVLKAIYAEDPMKREQALARIGQPNTIYYPDNGVTANVSTTYEVGGNGKWMKNGVVNLRCKVTDSEYAELWTGGLRFTDMSGNAITGTGYPYGYVDEDGIRHFYFKDYTTDMNVYMDYNPVALIETSGNSTTIGHFKKSHSVSVTRNTKAGVWNTICLPFKPTAAQLKQMFGDGVEIQAFTEVRKGTSGIDLVFAAIIDLNNFQAGVPYIVKPTSEALKTGVTLENVTFTAATAGSVTHSYDGDNYTFKGIYDPFAVTGENQKESNILFLSEGGLSYPKNNGDIKPFRCYFQISGQTVNLSRTNVVFGGETNAISSMPMSQEKQEMNMDRIFTIDGRFVGHSLKGLKKGLYIQNGKKIVID